MQPSAGPGRHPSRGARRNDGPAIHLCPLLGLMGASASPKAVRFTGLTSLVAGAFSMAAGSGQWRAGGDTGACGAGSNTRLGPSLSSRRRRTPEGSGVRPTSARRRGRQGVRSDVRQDTEERVPRSAQGATWYSRSRRAPAIDSCAVPRVLLVLRVAWPGQLSGCAGLPAMAAAAYRTTALVSGEPNTLL
ncbi:VIT1/CCC1 transporter family protein [Streptomyces peucetius]|uniref:VIT1/CCC1 transporter family protein n=1 Tax=Streptomyces peucetius TaxID=1950 RepID=UPI0039B0C019